MWHSDSYDEVLYRVRRTKQIWRNVSITEGVLTFFLILFGLLLPCLVLEGLLHFSVWIRVAIFGMLVGVGIAAAVWYVFRPILAARSDERVALKIEEAFPRTNNLLINSIRLGKDGLAQGRSMVDSLMTEAAKGVRNLDFDRSVGRSRCVKRGAAVAALGVCLALFLVITPLRFRNAFGRLMAPLADIPAMGRVAIEDVKPGDCELLAGSDLDVRATIAGGGDEEFDAAVFLTPKDGREKAFPMSPEGKGVYSYVVPGVRSPLEYHVEIGGTESRTYAVKIVRRPSVKRIELAYQYPKYTQLDPVTVDNSDGSIQAVTGTKVGLKIEATKDIAKGWIEISGGKTVPLNVGLTPTALSGQLSVDGDYGYRVHLTDTHGYESEDPVERFVTATPDGKPTVVINEPGKDVEAALDGRIQLVVRGSDDFGIAGARLLMKKEKTSAEEEVQKWSDFPNPRNVSITYGWRFPKANFKAGDEVTYWVEMTDTCPSPEPNRAASDKFIVKLIDLEKQRRDQVEKYKLWEKKLQEVLKQQKDARQEAGALLGPSSGGKKK